jgi:hypothetical protein
MGRKPMVFAMTGWQHFSLYIYTYQEELRSSYDQLLAKGGRTKARDGGEEALTAG